MRVVVAQHRPRVVQLVGHRHQQRVLADLAEVVDIALLAFEPRRLGHLVGVAALLDDARDVLAEVGADLLQRRRAALVFDRVVQQRGDGLVLGAPVVDHQARHRQQMADIRNVAALAHLVVVLALGIHQRLGESAGQFRCLGVFAHSPPTF